MDHALPAQQKYSFLGTIIADVFGPSAKRMQVDAGRMQTTGTDSAKKNSAGKTVPHVRIPRTARRCREPFAANTAGTWRRARSLSYERSNSATAWWVEAGDFQFAGPCRAKVKIRGTGFQRQREKENAI
jgi:hypothetical protein